MKRWKTMVSIILVLLMFSGIAHGVGNKMMKITMNGKNISVNQVSVMKDGKVIDIELPSVLYIDRVLVPVRIAEELGAKVDWNQRTKTVTVSHNRKDIKLTIDSSIASIGNEKKTLDKNSIPRLVIFADGDARTMVPLSFMSEMLGYDIGWDNKDKVAFINSKKEVEKEIEEKVEVDLSNKVMKVNKETVDGKEAIVIYGTKDVQRKMMKMKNPERIVMDFLDSTLQGSTYYEYNYNLGFIEGVRVSQFQPDNNYKPDDKIVRLVLDGKDGVVDPNIKIETYENKIVIFPEMNSWENINYNVERKERTITINNLKSTSYSVDYDSINKVMEINIPKDAAKLVPGILPINDPLVNDIKIVEESGKAKVIIQFKRGIEYDVDSKKVDNKIIVQIKKDHDIKPGNRIIVIDPGHGGKDPGAVSPNKVREKDLVLDVSFKLKNALEEKGYNIIMTRERDEFIGLYDRSKIANEAFADIFVSIHANSTTNRVAHGIEVLYAPANGNSNKTEDQYPLSKAILDEVIKATDANSRGTIQRPNLIVLRQTKMPASMVEIGFLSNENEEKLITSDDYQDKIITGIVKGIENYFDEY